MYYGNINTHDIANGQGIRVSLFVSGCRHRCPGCFNQGAQNFDYGSPFTEKEQEDIIKRYLKPNYIKGITFLGGDPMEPENQEGVAKLIKRIKEVYKDSKDIWLYTGAVYESLIDETSRYRTKDTDYILENIDVLIDGPFILAKRDIQNVPFRGSTNQRLLDMKETNKTKKAVDYILQ